MRIREDYSLINDNSFHLNARARFFAICEDIDDLFSFLSWRKDNPGFPLLIMGEGSNILFVSDFNGFVLKSGLKGMEVLRQEANEVYVKAMAGESWDDFVSYTVNKGYWGIENLSNIPGSVGSSPVQNIGAYGIELKDVFYKLEALDLEEGKIVSFDAAACRFAYRNSIFKTNFKNRYYILSVVLRLSTKPRPLIDYGNVKEYLRADRENLSPAEIRKAICEIRSAKLPDPDVLGNAGSFFKNPILNASEFNSLSERHRDIPYYKTGPESFKIPAAWLIENSGWKGKRRGDAGVHTKQALVLLNYGHASGNDIYQLSLDIARDVKRNFGIQLEAEVNII